MTDPIAPPQSVEDEQAVLGAVLLVGGDLAASLALDVGLRAEDFYRESHGLIWAAMLGLHDQGEPVDTLTVAAELKRRGKFDQAGGQAALDLASGIVPGVSNARGYARTVVEMAGWRRYLHGAYDVLANVHDRNRQGVEAALGKLHDAAAPPVTADPAAEFIAWYENQRKGIPLPFGELTEATGGLQVGEVTMLAGWPGFGKTFLAKDIMLTATAAGGCCHEYANETVGPRRTARLIATLTGISPHKIAERKLTPDEWKQAMRVLQQLPYETTPTYGWNVEDYCRDLRRHKWDLAVIDTVTRLPCQRVDEWDRASGMLADTAAQTGTHLILICQLNLGRDTNVRRPEPTGRDLRNTGAWYQDARVVLFVHRDQEVIEAGGTEIPRVLSDGHVRVDKATHGEPERGFVSVTFNPRWARFDRLDAYHRPDEAAAA